MKSQVSTVIKISIKPNLPVQCDCPFKRIQVSNATIYVPCCREFFPVVPSARRKNLLLKCERASKVQRDSEHNTRTPGRVQSILLRISSRYPIYLAYPP